MLKDYITTLMNQKRPFKVAQLLAALKTENCFFQSTSFIKQNIRKEQILHIRHHARVHAHLVKVRQIWYSISHSDRLCSLEAAAGKSYKNKPQGFCISATRIYFKIICILRERGESQSLSTGNREVSLAHITSWRAAGRRRY